MKVKFFGTPNMLIKSKTKKYFENKIQYKPLFRFNDKGEYITEDERLIHKLKSRFDHVELIDNEEKEEVEELHLEEKIEPLETNIERKEEIKKENKPKKKRGAK